MAPQAKSLALAALVLLSPVVMCVRNGGSAESMSTSVGPGPLELIASLQKAVLTKVQLGKGEDPKTKVSNALERKFKEYKKKQDLQSGGNQLNEQGWGMYCKAILQLTSERCADIWEVVKKGDKKNEYIFASDLANIVLGGGVSAEVGQVLDDVWTMLGAGDTLQEADLRCSKNKPALLEAIANGGGSTTSGVTKEVFKKYYDNILSGMGHQHKVLMIVNAWHLTGGVVADTPIGPMHIYDYINTANLRVRCITDAANDADGGKVVMLANDCGQGEGEDAESRTQIVQSRLAQEGVNCQSISFAD